MIIGDDADNDSFKQLQTHNIPYLKSPDVGLKYLKIFYRFKIQ